MVAEHDLKDMHGRSQTSPLGIENRLGHLLVTLLVILPLVAPSAVFSSTQNRAETCRIAARNAAAKTGIPVTILHAISLTETGRKKDGKFEPWPWTINMEGKGVWFKSRENALAYANKNFERGARSFDVGCFQINYKWHHKAFNSIEHMFEPTANAHYAAQYLLSLFDEKGNWESAVGAYHSRTPKFANKYKKRFSRIHAQISGQDTLPKAAKTALNNRGGLHRENLYPLLVPTKAGGANGSLFNLGDQNAGAQLIALPAGRLF